MITILFHHNQPLTSDATLFRLIHFHIFLMHFHLLFQLQLINLKMICVYWHLMAVMLSILRMLSLLKTTINHGLLTIKAIIICILMDLWNRGYESYDNIFLCELKKLNYVFRVKTPSSAKSLLSSYSSELPDEQEEFDVKIKRFFTRKCTTIMKDQADVYHILSMRMDCCTFIQRNQNF